METKICSICNQEKSLNEYYPKYNSLYKRCKKCYLASYYSPIKITCECGKQITDKCYPYHLKTEIHRRRMDKVKKCHYCQIEKPYNCFHKSKKSGDGHTGTCKECHKKLFYKHESNQSK